MLRAALVAIMLFALPAPPAAVVQQQWVHLGSRVVGSGGDRDIIRTEGEGRIKRIRFLVEGCGLELFDVMTSFADGKTCSTTVRFSFAGNRRSPVIAMP